MLQQTQAPRVVTKYNEFITLFPDLQSLAKAPLRKILRAWQGLGYNRRALNLQRSAQIILNDYKGVFPKDRKALETLPGVGPATAGDIMAFAWNKPEIVIETNIRSVFIHCFFNDQKDIDDKEILPLIAKTLDKKNPRHWYYALMDYGAMLKKTIPNPSRRSKHYATQSPFKGSNRELRSHILKYLLAYGPQKLEIIIEALDQDATLIKTNLQAMKKEGLITSKKNLFLIAN